MHRTAKVLELIFHSRQEDFPVVDHGTLVGFITRQDIMNTVHQFGTAKPVSEVMRTRFPKVKEAESLLKVQALMQEANLRAIPVMRDDAVEGVVTLEDIGRVYVVRNHKM